MKQIILDIIRYPVDAKDVLTQHEITEKYITLTQENITPRQVRKLIRELREDGYPILSSSDNNLGGYRMARSKEEGLEWYQKLRRRALKELVIARIVRDSCRKKFSDNGVGQLRMFELEKVG